MREKEAAKQQVIPEYVGKRSYIEASSQIIHLLSHDYHTVGEQEWVVSSGAVTVKMNQLAASQTILFSHITTINIGVTENVLGKLWFTGPAVIREEWDDNISSVRRYTDIPEVNIYFKLEDMRFAEAIRDRISNPFNRTGF